MTLTTPNPIGTGDRGFFYITFDFRYIITWKNDVVVQEKSILLYTKV